MATFVLVPGFWLGAWAWDDVAARLRAGGHDVHAVTLPGLAERAGEAAAADIGLDAHVADLVGVIEGRDLRDVVLVGHSGANMTVTGVADRIPGRLARVVYVDAAPLPSGMAMLDFFEPQERAATEERVVREGGGRMIPPPPFDPAEDPQNLAGLSPERLAELRERATPQPYGTGAQPLPRPERVPDTPKTLVATTFPVAMVETLAAGGNPVFAMSTGPEWTYRELPTGHWPMLSRPADLADVLADLADLA
ncbi:alpha/beta fold hydrolase [Thermomonospora umbrina]|uniref:Pimeloyl-ACP methyl ester carboxylesterase n=1 Tax=Thermomonospora umbrina TaxID=111806 RepID=A0A3D9SWV0_9ACTN|nr:alpha/beta hydrolase [Thermomonospora umbrina]REF00433.1 pimeloyl-ACP methyl ester carboxylesterase [Thermomonospora umbrina]